MYIYFAHTYANIQLNKENIYAHTSPFYDAHL